MSRDQMRNIETFKIGSSQVNEFEYQKNRGQMTEQFEHHPEGATGAKPMTQAERVKAIMAAAHKKVEKRRKKESPKAEKSQSMRLDGASKDAAKLRVSKLRVSRKTATKKISKKR